MQTEKEFLTELVLLNRKYLSDLLGDKKHPLKLDDSNWGLWTATNNLTLLLEARLKKIEE